MKLLRTLMICAVLFGSVPGSTRGGQTPAPPLSKPGFTLTSAFDDGGVIPAKYTHSVPNPISPKLDWTNVPENTISFVLIVHDLNVTVEKRTEDALHWAAFNIPGTATGLPENVPASPQLPDGTIQLKVIRGLVGYFGPGAPPGPYHHYNFDLYALDTKLDLGPDATRADILKAIDGHILGKAVLVGRFHR